MATYTFIGGTGGNSYGHSGNWSSGIIPTLNDTALFTALSPTCSINGGYVVGNLDCTNYGATMTFLGGASTSYIGVTAGGGITLGTAMGISLGTPISEGATSAAYPQTFNGLAIYPGTATWTTNGKVIPFVTTPAGSNLPVATVILNGTCTIQGSEIRYDRGSVAAVFNGSPLVLRNGWHYWRLTVSGSSDIRVSPPSGATVTLFNEQSSAVLDFRQIASNLVFSGAGNFIHWGVLNKVGGTMTYVSGGITSQIKNGNEWGWLEIAGNSNISLGNSQWRNLRLYGNTTFLTDGKFGNDADFRSSTVSGNGRIVLNGSNTGVCGYTSNINAVVKANILISGTGTRSISPASGQLFSLTGGTSTIGMSGGTINILNVFALYGNQHLINASSSTNVNGVLADFRFFGPTGAPFTLNVAGITLGTGISLTGSQVNISSPVYFNTLRTSGSAWFAGNVGWTASNFIHGGQTVTLGTTGAYVVTSNFQMQGSNATGGRATLQSDTRSTFIGSVAGTNLIYTSGTAPFIGGVLGVATGQIIEGLANLLPNRPVVISGGPVSWTLNQSVSPGTGPYSFSVGKKATFTLFPGASQSVIWAATQDIDSSEGIPVSPVDSYNDSAGITNPTLLRTLNWGTLAPPTRPAAFTFVT
jgi:hypothetical protein